MENVVEGEGRETGTSFPLQAARGSGGRDKSSFAAKRGWNFTSVRHLLAKGRSPKETLPSNIQGAVPPF